MTPRPNSLPNSADGFEGVPRMDELQPWTNPLEDKVPTMDQLQPWSPTADRSSNMPTMDQLKPWNPNESTAPPATVPPPAPPETKDDQGGPPGTWQVIKSAFGRKMAEDAANAATGARILLPKGVGGLSFLDQYQAGQATPEHKDHIDELLGQGIGEGWSNPQWWAAQMAGNLGGVVPGLGVATAASLTPAGPLGGIAGFAGEAALARLPAAFNAAKAEGLDDQAAVRRAITDSGITAAFAGAMGMAGKFGVTKAITPYVSENVAKVLARPAAESLAQLGLVQPGLMAAQDIATSASHGQLPSADQLMTDMVVGGLAGAAIHQVFKRMEPKETVEPAGAASEAAAQRPATIAQKLGAKAEPAVPVGPAAPASPADSDQPADNQYYVRDLTPATRRDGELPFGGIQPDVVYHQIGDAVSEMPDRTPAKDVMPYLNKKGVPEDVLRDTFIPRYLEDVNGQINKRELQTWIDMQRTEALERIPREEDAVPGKLGVKENPRDFAFRTPAAKAVPEPADRKALLLDSSGLVGYARARGLTDENVKQLIDSNYSFGGMANKVYGDYLQAKAVAVPPAPDAGAFARAQTNIARDRDGQWNMVVGDLQANQGKVPGLAQGVDPREVTARRLMQIAADRGITRMSYSGDDPGLGKIFQKTARMFGEARGETNFPDRVDTKPLPYVGVSAKMASHRYNHGESLYDTDPEIKSHPAKGTKTLSDFIQTNEVPKELIPDFKKIGTAINKMANQLGITRGVDFIPIKDPNERARGFLKGSSLNPVTGNYEVMVNLHRLTNRNELYASMSHEFGHVVMEDKYKTANDVTKAALKADYEAKRPGWNDPRRTVGDVRRERDNAISLMAGGRSAHDHYLLSDLVPKSKNYFTGFEEYFAENVAKWMQTDERPLGVVDTFFKRLGNVIRKVLTQFRQMGTPGRPDPDAAIKDWLNRMWDRPKGWSEPHMQQFDMDTVKKAQGAFDKEGAPETKAVPMQGSTVGGRGIVNNLPPEVKGAGGDAMPAHADRINAFYKWAVGLPQLQDLNKQNWQLADYTDMHRMANTMKNDIMSHAENRVEEWSKLNKDQLFGLTNFIQDYAHEDLRPGAQWLQDAAQKHKLNPAAVKLFHGVVQDFDDFLERYRKVLLRDAALIKDPRQQADNIKAVNDQVDKMLRKPFMPIVNFGKYNVTVYGNNDNITHYETTNSLKRQRQIVEELEKNKMFPSDRVLPGMVAKDVAPFVGMPPGMIDLVGQKLSLSATQRAALDQLRFDYAPSQTFKHQFRNLDLVPGYSTDFPRAYASFFFHGANHLTRITWVDQMRDRIRSLGSDAERLTRVGDPDGANKLDQITKFMQNHFDAWVDPKNDWATLKGLMFHWYLGMSPAKAANNLTQTALSTYPWMASKYGDFATAKAIAKASLNLNNFYKKGTIEDYALKAKNDPTPQGAWARALGEAVKGGTITESQSHQLAAVSEDRNLLRAFGPKGASIWQKFSEASSWMFDLSEQYNRRVAFRAAWDAAREAGPDHKAVKEAVARYPLIYKSLIDSEANGGKNWTPQEAATYLAAKHAVDATQFEFAPYARPEAFRGKLGNVLIFKQFTQNMLFNLASNPGMLARWLVIMGGLGGVGGIAGYENVNSVIKTVAARVFGKDFDLDDEVRHFAHDVLNDVIPSDMLLHGAAVKGFGIPHVMHSIGATWFPTIDMSRAIGMGDVLGFDPMKLTGLAPSLHPKEEELRQIERASGAAFQIPFSLFDFASSSRGWDDLKAYEPILPNWMAAISHAYRWTTQGRETNAAGNTVIRFDPSDTEHMSEIFARALGFQNRRLTEQQERTQALTESSDFYDLRHSILLRQYGDAMKNGDRDSAQRVVEAVRQYNEQLPPEARGKAVTGKELTSSARQRMGIAQKAEMDIPAKKSNIPLYQAMQPYFPRGWPEDQVGARPVN